MNVVPLSDIFNIEYGSQLDLNKLEVDLENGNNFISRSRENLGVQTKIKKVANKQLFKKGSITVALGGSVLSSFVQQKDFYTGQNIKVLTAKKELPDLEKKFYCMTIEFNAYRYSACGREANKTLDNLLVPDVGSVPIWVNSTKVAPPSKKNLINKNIDINVRQWKYFNLENLFTITGSNSFTKKQINNYGVGKYPYVVTSSENNGTQGFYDHFTEKGNVLTVDSATIGSCFYQSLDFSASDHVEKLIPKGFVMNVFIAIFIQTIISMEKFRYGYGRKFAQQRIKKTKIKLPAKSNSKGDCVPDWQFMEDYIKSLPYSSNLPP